MIKLCVSGSKGKMGSSIIRLAKDDPEFQVAGEFDIGVDPKPLIAECDCLIDFTAPEATIANLAICKELKKPIVIGTTGMSEADRAKIKDASHEIAIVLSPNMSIAVNVLFKLVEEAAKVLTRDYEIDILEAHHAHKKDAPSGTAKELAKIIKETNSAKEVPIESVREDEIVGEHTITFESPYDLIELTHSAKTRDIFAKGALTAAKFVVKKDKGLYTMKDVLAL